METTGCGRSLSNYTKKQMNKLEQIKTKVGINLVNISTLITLEKNRFIILILPKSFVLSGLLFCKCESTQKAFEIHLCITKLLIFHHFMFYDKPTGNGLNVLIIKLVLCLSSARKPKNIITVVPFPH